MRLPEMDDPVDELNRGMYRGGQAAGRPRALEWGVRMNVVSRHIERVGDNAVDIAEQVAYLLTGEFREFTDASHETQRRCDEPGCASSSSRTRSRSPRAIQFVLEREGFDVDVATDGERALERFRAYPPSLVLLDLMLPELSGLDVCRIVRSESDVPIIMVTAKDAEADKVAGLELGADDYVTKPFSMRELVSRVRAHLRRARMVSEPAESRCSPAGPWSSTSRATRCACGRETVAVDAEGVRAPRDVPAAQGPPADTRLPDRGGLGRGLLRRHEDARRPREAAPPEDRGRSARARCTWSRSAGSATSSSADRPSGSRPSPSGALDEGLA